MRFIKIIRLICLIPVLSLLTGCGVRGIITDIVDNIVNYESPYTHTVGVWHTVYELTLAKDTDAIYDLFSDYAKTHADLMPQIEQLVNFLDGEVVEMQEVGASRDYAEVRGDEKIRDSYSADTYLVTDKGTRYWFRVGIITIDPDETKLGVYFIYVLNSTLAAQHTEEWVEWRNNNYDDKDAEPPVPDDMKVDVCYPD